MWIKTFKFPTYDSYMKLILSKTLTFKRVAFITQMYDVLQLKVGLHNKYALNLLHNSICETDQQGNRKPVKQRTEPFTSSIHFKIDLNLDMLGKA